MPEDYLLDDYYTSYKKEKTSSLSANNNARLEFGHSQVFIAPCQIILLYNARLFVIQLSVATLYHIISHEQISSITVFVAVAAK